MFEYNLMMSVIMGKKHSRGEVLGKRKE